MITAYILVFTVLLIFALGFFTYMNVQIYKDIKDKILDLSILLETLLKRINEQEFLKRIKDKNV
jgi:hypothetical protein